MTIVTIGIDLAKNVFAVHGVDATGKAVLVQPSVARTKLLELIASLPASSVWKRAPVCSRSPLAAPPARWMRWRAGTARDDAPNPVPFHYLFNSCPWLSGDGNGHFSPRRFKYKVQQNAV